MLAVEGLELNSIAGLKKVEQYTVIYNGRQWRSCLSLLAQSQICKSDGFKAHVRNHKKIYYVSGVKCELERKFLDDFSRLLQSGDDVTHSSSRITHSL